MELRLSAIRGKTSTLVNVEGRLGTPTVKLLERLVRNAKGAVTVDLTNLLSADDAGVAALRTLAGRGARLVGASPYITLLLRSGGWPDPPPRGRLTVPLASRRRRPHRRGAS